jgi:pimeloyl-ACP methyl ester carboxylesterase
MTENVSAAPVSPDGPVIAFTAWGQGEPLAIIDGAPAINPTNEQIGRLRSNEFRTYAYDRRGRGQSTDTAPYAVEREIEDLAALVEVAGPASDRVRLVVRRGPRALGHDRTTTR